MKVVHVGYFRTFGQTNEIRMNFLPSLKLLNPVEQRRTYHIDLFYSDLPVEGRIPVIAFEVETDQRAGLVDDIEELGISGSELVQKAFRNLRTVEAQWKTVWSEGDSIVLGFDDHPAAAEQILNKPFLTRAHQALQTDTILVCIPCKGRIFCCPNGEDKSREYLSHLVRQYYNDFDAEQISSHLYLIEDGVIKQVDQVEHGAEVLQDTVEDSEVFSSKTIKMTLYQELFMVKIVIDSKELDNLSGKLFSLVKNALLDYGGKPGFNGKVSIQAARNAPEKGPKSIAVIRAFLERLRYNPTIAALVQKCQSGVEIDFQFGSDFNSGANDKTYSLKIQ